MPTKPKNTVPSAPEDMLEPGKLFARDGRKRKDSEFVGARNPDTDPDILRGRTPRNRRMKRGR
jgi:hypothetical protein